MGKKFLWDIYYSATRTTGSKILWGICYTLAGLSIISALINIRTCTISDILLMASVIIPLLVIPPVVTYIKKKNPAKLKTTNASEDGIYTTNTPPTLKNNEKQCSICGSTYNVDYKCKNGFLCKNCLGIVSKDIRNKYSKHTVEELKSKMDDSFKGQSEIEYATESIGSVPTKTAAPRITTKSNNESKAVTFCKRIVLACFCLGIILIIAMALIPAKEKLLVEGWTESQNTAVISALSACGAINTVDDINSIEHDALLDEVNVDGEKGYRVSTVTVNNIILYTLGGDVNMIRYADITFFENGTAVDDFANYTMTVEEQTKYQGMTERMVETILTSPSTAEFCGFLDYRFGKENGLITVQGYVDSQNAFGTIIRADFQAQFEEDTPTSLIVDGIEYLQ